MQTWQVSCVRRRQAGRGRQTKREKRQLNGYTYSAVICVTSGKELKPEPRKESRYWVIFNAASQSSTELTLLRSGAPRSNKGWWEGLQKAEWTGRKLSLKQNGWDRKRVFVNVLYAVSLLTQGQHCWCRLSEMQGCVSFCPTCWQYRGTLAVRSYLSASSPALVGAALLDSPWELAAGSPAQWHLSPGTWWRREGGGKKGKELGGMREMLILNNHLSTILYSS